MKITIRLIATILVAVMFSLTSKAGNIIVENSISLDLINGSSSVMTQDQYFGEILGGDYINDFVVNKNLAKVQLRFDDTNWKYYSLDWDVVLTYDLYVIDVLGNYQTYTGQTLTIDFFQNAPYNDIDIHVYENIIFGEISNIQIQQTQGLVLDSDMYLDVIIESDKTFNLNTTSFPNWTAQHLDASLREVEMTWDFLSGAESYDLEWVFVDLGIEDLDDQPFDFSNAVRVNVRNNHYRVTLMYPKGFFVFRIRGIGYDLASGRRVEGDWSLLQTGNAAAHTSQDYFLLWEDSGEGIDWDKNWVYDVSYAEDGLASENLVYSDGLARARQSISRSPEDGSVLINNNIYDYSGRETVQTLPTPLTDQGFKFYDNILHDGTDYFDYLDFDLSDDDITTSDNLNHPAAMQAGASGPGQYYSISNNSPLGMHGDYTPDAEGYPYVRSIISNDGTGRVLAQSSVGDNFKLDLGNDHVSRYYYGAPSQEELDRLLGNEAGLASHYQKMMLVDANGQAHISITDQAGATVITYMAGDQPNNLLPLDHISDDQGVIIGEHFTVDLTAFNEPNPVEDTLHLSHNFIVPYPSAYTFHYDLEEICYQDDDCYTTCDFCDYNLRLRLYLESTGDLTVSDILIWEGNYELDFPGDLAPIIVQTNLLTIDPDLATFLPGGVLQPGSYRMEKALSIDESTIDEALAVFLDQECNPPPSTVALDCLNCSDQAIDAFLLVDEYANVWELGEVGDDLVLVGNNLSYDNSIPEEPIDFEAWISAFEASISITLDASYNQADWDGADGLIDQMVAEFSECVNPALEIPDICESLKQVFLSDLYPGGQYFDNTPDIGEQGYIQNEWLDQLLTAEGVAYPHELNITDFDATHVDWDAVRDDWLNIAYDFGQIPPIANSTFEDEWIVYHPEFDHYNMYCNVVVTGQPGVDVDGYDNCGIIAPLTNDFYDYYEMSSAMADIDPNDTNDDYWWFNPLAAPQNSVDLGVNQNNSTYQNIGMPVPDILPDPLTYDCQSDPYQEFVFEPFIANFDAFFYAQDNLPYDPSQGLNNFLSVYNFAEDTYNGFHSIWYVLKDPGLIQSFVLSDLTINDLSPTVGQFYADWHLQNGGFDQVGKWQFFKSTYNFHRELAGYCWRRDGLLEFQTDEDQDGLTDAGNYFIRFPDNPIFSAIYDHFTNEIPQTFEWDDGLLTEINDILLPEQSEDICISQCEMVAQQVIQEAGACLDGLNPTELATLTTAIEVLCSGSCALYGHGDLDYIDNDPDHDVTYGTGTYDEIDYMLSTEHGCTTDFDYPVPEPTGDPSVQCACNNIETLLQNLDETYTLSNLTNPVIQALLLDEFVNLYGENDTEPSSTNMSDWITECAGDLMPTNLPSGLVCEDNFTLTIVTEDCGESESTLENFALQNLFQDNLDLLTSNFIEGFKARCFENIDTRETFMMEYDTKEYQYMLYYRDQSGNLVKTVPPLGVEPLLVPDITLASDDPATEIAAALADATLDTYDVQAHRDDPENYPFIYPAHSHKTRYKHNSLNNGRMTATPDGGASHFWFDQLGRIVASQNSLQLQQGEYSYLVFDELGRTIETGVVSGISAITPADLLGVQAFSNWVETGTERREVSRTYYETTIGLASVDAQFINGQQNLRNRVSGVTYSENPSLPLTDGDYESATHFTYDIHGNVPVLIQENTLLAGIGQDFKRIEYDYDLLTGNVNEVRYQPEKWDEYYHRYFYDKNNRLHEVWTSRDGLIWENDATYFYSATGQLARSEVGDKQVSANDFAYTLQGWLKGMNSSTVDRHRDIGLDAAPLADNPNEVFAADATGFTLHYFDDDFTTVNTGLQPGNPGYWLSSIGSSLQAESPGLYNGNIARMVTAHNQNLDDCAEPMQIHAYGYRYDQLQRIRQSKASVDIQDDIDDNKLGLNAVTQYSTEHHFDANGNITRLYRHGDVGMMDQMTYAYRPETNQLLNVVDVIGNAGLDDFGGHDPQYTDAWPAYPDEELFDYNLDGYTETAYNNETYNYLYDDSGQLIKDKAENIHWIEWTQSGKVKKVVRPVVTASNTYMDDLELFYDAGGNRTVKLVKPRDQVTGDLLSEDFWTYTFYVRDANGNPMATYDRTFSGTWPNLDDDLALNEHHIYGSDRLGTTVSTRVLSTGLYSDDFEIDYLTYDGISVNESSLAIITYDPLPNDEDAQSGLDYKVSRTLGKKAFESSNHLGNVLATMTDVHVAVEGNPGVASYFEPQLLSVADYYPFGMPQPCRSVHSDYRYGFHGEETDQEWLGGAVSFNYRVHDARIGKFLSLDPLASDYPHNSPYAFSENRVIDGVELEGLEYLDADEARIKIVYGLVKIRVANMSTSFQSDLDYIRSSGGRKSGTGRVPYGWGDGIGVTTTLGRLFSIDNGVIFHNSEDMSARTINGITAKPSPLSLNFYQGDYKGLRYDGRTQRMPGNREAMLGVNNGIALESFARNIHNASGGVKGIRKPAAGVLGISLLAMDLKVMYDAWNNALDYSEDHAVITVQNKVLPMIQADIMAAIEFGVIPPQFLNEESLGHIAQVMLTGENVSGNQQILGIATDILKYISDNGNGKYKGDRYLFYTNTELIEIQVGDFHQAKEWFRINKDFSNFKTE